ncbi:PREDICTED: poly [ADP-ribose] polymerase 12-like [Branchiostoma belcheri]|uniref:Poly [ADP-ribose] polymerase 12-like n=1 Tax=Branchiostoma belcheri TaxID=7741 RepID=A0A6P5A8T6_BRABE|nr:PREDICTED: poly [ADP-ribose] polymerase 12-like [Branchiostoma belcheri]
MYAVRPRNQLRSRSGREHASDPKTQDSDVRYFIYKRGGTVSVSELRNMGYSPQNGRPLDQWLSELPGRFVTRRGPSGQTEVVSAIVNVNLCYDYLHGGCARGTACKHLHVCRGFIAGHCRFESGNRCRFSHTFQEPQNRRLVERCGLGNLPQDTVRQVLCTSFPHVCEAHVRAGCPDQNSCPYLHICKDFVKSGCFRKDCRYPHDFGTRHNERVLRLHFLSPNLEQKYLINATLLMYSTNRMLTVTGNMSQSMQDLSSTPNSHNDSRADTLNGKGKGHGNMARMGRMGHSLGSLDVQTVTKQPQETVVFTHLCQAHGGTAPLNDVLTNSELFPEGVHARRWIKQRPHFFRIFKSADDVEMVSVLSPRSRLCHQYNNPMKGCTRQFCQYFHLCKKFVEGRCPKDGTCSYQHDLKNTQARENIRKYRLSDLNDDEVIKVIRLSSPEVCEAYNKENCAEKDTCHRLHVCANFVLEKCTSGSRCKLHHESSLDTKHTKTVLENYKMTGMESRSVIKVLWVCFDPPPPKVETTTTNQDGNPKSIPSPTETKTSTKPGRRTFVLNTEAHICEDFILDKCSKGNQCRKHHVGTPYLWQYKDAGLPANAWQDFNETMNERLERSFSDPSNNGAKVKAVGENWLIDFKHMTVQPARVKVRRLSTTSSKLDPAGRLATRWVWYWRDQSSAWVEYGNKLQTGTDAGPSSDDIEQAYLTGQPTVMFEVPPHRYRLEFAGMYQQNLNPHFLTRRDVRRRPVFVSRAEVDTKTSKPQQLCALPSTWTPMPAGQDFVRRPLSRLCPEFRVVEMLFRQTMGEEKVIVRIERVQNPFLWEKYNRKKEYMRPRLHTQSSLYRTGGAAAQATVDERTLFHGTEPDIVDGICRQNFDWRLCGKNATAFGQGSYFAVQASYSHRYTSPDTKGSHFIFLANVLVGSHTVGSSKMRRPPPIDPEDPNGELYDSCANSAAEPTIFVIFDSDQCYPTYLIEYWDTV